MLAVCFCTNVFAQADGHHSRNRTSSARFDAITFGQEQGMAQQARLFSEEMNDRQLPYFPTKTRNSASEKWFEPDTIIANRTNSDIRYLFVYNAQGNQLSYVYQNWENNAWVNFSQYLYTYDEFGNCILATFKEWFGNNWVIADHYLPFYYNNGQSYSEQYDFFYPTGYQLTISYTEIPNHNSVPEAAENDAFTLFPNPAHNTVNIEAAKDISRITVINVLGQIVYDAESVCSNKAEIDVSSYEAGIYMICIATEGNISTKRIVVAH